MYQVDDKGFFGKFGGAYERLCGSPFTSLLCQAHEREVRMPVVSEA